MFNAFVSHPIYRKKRFQFERFAFYSLRGNDEHLSYISDEFKSWDFHPTRLGDASESKSVSAWKHLEIHWIPFDGYSEIGEKAKREKEFSEMNERLGWERRFYQNTCAFPTSSPETYLSFRRASRVDSIFEREIKCATVSHLFRGTKSRCICNRRFSSEWAKLLREPQIERARSTGVC